MKPNFKEEKLLWKKGYKFVVGLDEAGRGPLAGPVVAGAVLIKGNNLNLKFFDGINDSKKLSEKQKNFFYEVLTNCEYIEWGVGIVSEKVIDKINILEASKLAMQKAVKDLHCATDYLLLDGNFKIKSDVPQKAIIKGDQKVISISSASIIAKVTRDRIMEKFHNKYPNYQFNKHKGYSTKLHLKMLKDFGICPIHRKSFRPVAEKM
jgi:ribonuclease HII